MARPFKTLLIFEFKNYAFEKSLRAPSALRTGVDALLCRAQREALLLPGAQANAVAVGGANRRRHAALLAEKRIPDGSSW